jgi:hypothetical protein
MDIFRKHYTFDELLQTRHADVTAFGANHSQTNNPSASWDANVNFDKAFNHAATGWKKGMEAAEKIINQLGQHLPQMSAPQKYTICDIAPENPLRLDPVALMCGMPTPFQRDILDEDTYNTGRKLARIAVNVSASAAVDAETILAKGAVVMALCDQLERLGVATEIVVVSPLVNRRGHGVALTATIKTAGEPWHPARAAAVIGHPAGLRRIFFRLLEAAGLPEEIAATYRLTYGFPAKLTEVLDTTQYDLLVDSTAIDTYPGGWASPTAQVAWVMDQLKAQGFEPCAV